MNQGKLDVVKWEMARVNINKLKCTGMGNLMQTTIISITVGKNPLKGID